MDYLVKYFYKHQIYSAHVHPASLWVNLVNTQKRGNKHSTNSNFNLFFTKRAKQNNIQKKSINRIVTLEQFGAKGDGITDDTQAISEALNSKDPVVYATKPKAYYKISDLIIINGVNKKKLLAKGAKFFNNDTTKATLLFQNSKNIEIQGGEYGYVSMPNSNGGNSQHVIQFDKCQNVLVNKIHVNKSPEMGIAITNSNYVTIQNSVIEHTFRDGTYAHYSANIKYIHNIYNNIKDDAMSFHDYGLDSEKAQLSKYGYKQASNFLAQDNTIRNVYQGVGSIGANNVKILNNKISNTVIAGIAIFNSKELYPAGTALVKNVQLVNNTINNSCTSTVINDKLYNNYGQASTGRAAIFVGSLGSNNQVNRDETKRLKNVIVKDNKITNSKAHGFWGSYVDGLHFINNKFSDCSGSVPTQSLTGSVIEIGNVTGFLGENNSVIDDRPKALHSYGYSLVDVTGETGSWNIKGYTIAEKNIVASKSLKFINKSKNDYW